MTQPRRIVYGIGHPADYYLMAGFRHLLGQAGLDAEHGYRHELAILDDTLPDSAGDVLAMFDAHTLVGTCEQVIHPRRYPEQWRRIRRLQANARAMRLEPDDVLLFSAWRAFPTNVFIRGLGPRRPRLIAIRKADFALETGVDGRLPLVSLRQNLWNRLFACSTMRYRWQPGNRRIHQAQYHRNPFDRTFATLPLPKVGQVEMPPGVDAIPYPYAAIPTAEPAEPKPPAVLLLGELYPFHVDQQMAELVSQFNALTDHLRRTFPNHRLLFKPRKPVDGLGFDLDGFEIGWQNEMLDHLLVSDPGIELVVSFKSSGCSMAVLYGRRGVLLYRMTSLPDSYKATLDDYFAAIDDRVEILSSLDRLQPTSDAPFLHPISLPSLIAASQPLVSAIAHPCAS